jgi:uncharacterized membrane protein YjgN (DUF898 family)
MMQDQIERAGPWTRMAGPAPKAPEPSAETIRFAFVNRPGLLKLTIVNFLLGLITFGIYRFWGKTRVRQHIWSSVHINEEPLEYTGTGWELFKGFLLVLLLILLPAVALVSAVQMIFGPQSTEYYLTSLALAIIGQLFIGYAIYSSRHYQLTRTNWRGIRGALTGSPIRYSLTYFGAMIAKVFSLGWATPVMNTLLQEQLIGDTKFGDAALRFSGRARPLYPTYALCWLLSLALVLGIPLLAWLEVQYGLGIDVREVFDKLSDMRSPASTDVFEKLALLVVVFLVAFVLFMLVFPMLWAVYTAKQFRTFATYSRFDGAPFRFEATTRSLIWLTIINLLILIFTAGIGRPFIQRRLVKYFVDRLSVDGLVELDRIRQSTARRVGSGDGLADAFELGTF